MEAGLIQVQTVPTEAVPGACRSRSRSRDHGSAAASQVAEGEWSSTAPPFRWSLTRQASKGPLISRLARPPHVNTWSEASGSTCPSRVAGLGFGGVVARQWGRATFAGQQSPGRNLRPWTILRNACRAEVASATIRPASAVFQPIIMM